ncbi:hypothetical protein VPH35_017574 [Triticum aestivum]
MVRPPLCHPLALLPYLRPSATMVRRISSSFFLLSHQPPSSSLGHPSSKNSPALVLRQDVPSLWFPRPWPRSREVRVTFETLAMAMVAMACWVSVSQIDICLRKPKRRTICQIFWIHLLKLKPCHLLLQIKDARVVFVGSTSFFVDSLIPCSTCFSDLCKFSLVLIFLILLP